MADRTCPCCGKVLKTPIDYRRHLARKTPCVPILDHEAAQTVYGQAALEDPELDKKKCRFCGRVFTSYTSMRRHVRNSCKIAPNMKNGDAGMGLLYQHTIDRQQQQIEALATQNAAMAVRQDEMMNMVLQLVGQKGSTQVVGEVAVQIPGDHNHVAVAVDNSKNITINVFGQEGVDHATMERIKAILDKSLEIATLPEAARAAVLQTAQLIYSDPAHPENFTCFLPNKKTNDALVHGVSGWEVQPVSLILPPMTKKSVDTLFDQQPYDNAEAYGDLMKELAMAEAKHADIGDMRPLLVRNKAALAAVLGVAPRVGGVLQQVV
jgi:hypothetical protein